MQFLFLPANFSFDFFLPNPSLVMWIWVIFPVTSTSLANTWKARTSLWVDVRAVKNCWIRTLLSCNKSCGRPSKFVMVRSRCFSYFYPLSNGKLLQLPIRLLYLIKFLLLHVLPTIPSECFERQRLNRIEWAGNVEAVCVRNLKWWISSSNMSYNAEITVRPLPTARLAFFCGSPSHEAAREFNTRFKFDSDPGHVTGDKYFMS